ncbi:tetratricopeptide repeat protein [Methanocaldococcus indicus]|uniref:tetratricopeptide repeat protein n=1 Tax=Methanocaldococcus indicus TaxID=213231 RepID=UPI003C6D806A
MKKYPRISSLEATTYVLRAYRMLYEGKLLEALYYINEALELEEDFKLALFLKGLILQALGEIEKAKECFELLCKESKNPIDWMFLGQCYAMSGDCSSALKCYDKSLEVSSNFLSGYILKILCLENLGEYEKVLDEIDKLLVKASNSVPLYLKKAEILKRMGKYEDALDTVNRGLKIYPYHKSLLFLKGLLLFRLGHFKESAETFKTLIDKLGAYWLETLKYGAEVMTIIGDYETAEKYIDRALKIRDDDIELLYQKGIILMYKNELEEALKYFKKILKLDPNYLKAILRIANIYERLGKLNEAIEYYNKLNK